MELRVGASRGQERGFTEAAVAWRMPRIWNSDAFVANRQVPETNRNVEELALTNTQQQTSRLVFISSHVTGFRSGHS